MRRQADELSKQELEKLLHESEARFQEVLQYSTEAAYKRNVQTATYEYLSPVFLRISGYAPEEMMRWSMAELAGLIHPEDYPSAEQIMRESTNSESGTTFHMEYRFKHKDGQYRWFHDQFTVLRDEAGMLLARVGSVREITEQQRVEAAGEHQLQFSEE